MTNVIIPNSVTNLGHSAFSHCTSLTTLNIPSSIVDVPSSAFAGCLSLTNVTLPLGVTYYWSVQTIEPRARVGMQAGADLFVHQRHPARSAFDSRTIGVFPDALKDQPDAGFDF